MAWTSTSALNILALLYPPEDDTAPDEDNNFPAFIDGVDDADGSLAPFVPTPLATIAAVMDAVQLIQGCHVLELGSGDGRISIAAALHPRVAKVTGIELDPDLVSLASAKVRQAAQLGTKGTMQCVACSFVQGDVYQLLSGQAADVNKPVPWIDVTAYHLIILYLLPEAEAKLGTLLRRAYETGVTIVSITFSLDLGFSLLDRTAGCYIYQTKA